jgi:hypothetical protein
MVLVKNLFRVAFLATLVLLVLSTPALADTMVWATVSPSLYGSSVNVSGYDTDGEVNGLEVTVAYTTPSGLVTQTRTFRFNTPDRFTSGTSFFVQGVKPEEIIIKKLSAVPVTFRDKKAITVW